MMKSTSTREHFLRGPFLLALAMLASERPAHAYTDPGSGMLLWQMLLAAVAGAAFYFRRFVTWIRNRKGPRE